MKRAAFLLGVATLVAALPARANEELARKYGCLACHTADKKLVGPSYKEVAAKYRGDKAAEAKLIDRSEEHTSELQSQSNLVCRLLLEKKKKKKKKRTESES